MRWVSSTSARAACVAAAALFAAAAAQAQSTTTIAGLVNTGDVDSLVLDLVSGVMQDSAYELSVISGSTVAAANGLGFVSTSYPGVWLQNDAVSSWLTPAADGWTSLDPSVDGVYQWTLSFDMTGLQLNSASFAGRVAADNTVSVALNGQTLVSSPVDQNAFTDWTVFSANSGFISGVNTLTFTVVNKALDNSNPTGLRVEFTESVATVSSVPEPASVLLMASGALALLQLAARRSRQG